MRMLRKYSVYITVLFTSMAGASLGGVSLTKIAFIPLMLVLFMEFKPRVTVYKPVKKILLYYILIIVSSFWGLTKRNMFLFDTYENKLIMNILQYAIIYLPTCLLLAGSRYIDDYKEFFKKAMVVLAEINCIWGIIQFAFWTFGRIDFNSLVFIDILHGRFGTQWTTYSQTIGSSILIKNLRVSGLNFEPACFCFILLLGYILDDKIWHKVTYILVIVLSLSRAGIVVACFVVFLDMIKTIKKLNRRLLQKIVFGGIIISITLLILSKTAIGNNVRNQMQVLFARFSLIRTASAGDGTYRHIMYVFWAIRDWVLNLGAIQKIIGVGYRVSGIVFSNNVLMHSMLQESMITQAWAVENDFADVLLGTGVLGIYLLYSFWYSVYKICNENVKKIIKMILIFGVFYNVSIWTFTSLIFLYFIVESAHSIKEKRDLLKNRVCN